MEYNVGKGVYISSDWLLSFSIPTLLEFVIVGPGPKQVIKMDIGIKVQRYLST